jgi:molecular chaperone GrpE (heat shock protein)
MRRKVIAGGGGTERRNDVLKITDKEKIAFIDQIPEKTRNVLKLNPEWKEIVNEVLYSAGGDEDVALALLSDILEDSLKNRKFYDEPFEKKPPKYDPRRSPSPPLRVRPKNQENKHVVNASQMIQGGGGTEKRDDVLEQRREKRDLSPERKPKYVPVPTPTPTPGPRKPPRGFDDWTPGGGPLPVYTKPIPKKSSSSEEEEEEEEEEADESGEEEEDVDESEEESNEEPPKINYLTEDQLIAELGKRQMKMLNKYREIWNRMSKKDTTWQEHLYELYIQKGKKNFAATVEIMQRELEAEAAARGKKGRKGVWRILTDLPDAMSQLSLGTVCVTCFESKCNGKHKV